MRDALLSVAVGAGFLASAGLLSVVAWGAIEPPSIVMPIPVPPTPPVTKAPEGSSPPNRYGRLMSKRWGYGVAFERENLTPVANPHPNPERQPVRERPYDVEITPDGKKVYVALQGTERLPGHVLAVYDVERDAVTKRILLKPASEKGEAASSPYRLVMHPGGRFLVVSSRYSNFLSVVDTRKDEVVSEIPLDFYAQGFTFDREGKTLYVTDRYLDQVLVIDVRADGERFQASLRELGGLDEKAFTADIHPRLVRRCGSADCHAVARGGLLASPDAKQSFLSVLPLVSPGSSKDSRLLRAVTRTRVGGYADRKPPHLGHAMGTVVFPSPAEDADYAALAGWIDSSRDGPGIPVGNPRSKPKVASLSTDGRFLFVGNTGTQDISIVSTRSLEEVGGIYLQNTVNDLKVVRSPATGHDYLVVATEGVGFGVVRERDPDGSESWDPKNPAAHFSVKRDLATGKVLPKDQQEILGPFDAVDGTASIKFRDIQNDVVFLDVTALALPERAPSSGPAYLLKPDRYESHRAWVRYTSDTAESTWGDVKGDIPPELMRVVGAFPEKIAVQGDRLFVTMQASAEVQEWRLNAEASDPADSLVPVRNYPTGIQPIGLCAGPDGTPAAGKLFVANFLSQTLTVIDRHAGTSREVVVDPSILKRPIPDSNAERGEFISHTAMLSSDGDTSCFHCHYLDTGDGRPWGVSQVVGQEFVHEGAPGQFVIGGAMSVPQMRNLFATQPFFFEGTLSAYEPRSMIMEHSPSDDFGGPTPQGDFTWLEADAAMTGVDDVQSAMEATTAFQSSLEERRDEMFRRISMRLFGKAFALRDFQRFVGDWQAHEPRLLPNPFDRRAASVLRGKALFEDPQVGCVACHAPPSFTRKDLGQKSTGAMPAVVTVTPRDASFTLIGMNRLDYLNGYPRDLEPWDAGRNEEGQGRYTTFPLRGLWERPPVFLHGGVARNLREVVSSPAHNALRRFKYEPLLGGEPERPGRREVGFNETFYFFSEKTRRVQALLESEGRMGMDTHGGTSHLKPGQIDDLVDFLESIE
ncbi:MAG TPA: hypothetical protein VGK67_30910 [Myxococcales bacterium]